MPLRLLTCPNRSSLRICVEEMCWWRSTTALRPMASVQRWGWREGEYVIDQRVIDLTGQPAGSYALYVGLYDPVTGVRMPAYDHEAALASDEVYLGEIEVLP